MKKVSAGIICRDGLILVCQRPEGKSLSGFWEFPGGKLEEGETLPQCLKRELLEELDISVKVGNFFMKSVYQYEFGEIELYAYFVEMDEEQKVSLKIHQNAEWVKPEDLDKFRFSAADIPIMQNLKKYFLKS